MAYRLLPDIFTQIEDVNGNPAAGYTLEFYVYNTSTPATLYTNSTGTALGTSCTLNLRGCPQTGGGTEVSLFGDTAQAAGYKLILKDAVGGTVRTYDGPIFTVPVTASDLGSSSSIAEVGRVVDSIAALKTLDKTLNSKVFVTGYYAKGDGGGGQYYYDSSDTTSTDNGGTIIVGSDGGRWKLILTTDVTVKQFGAKADNTTNDFQAFQSAVTWGMSTGGATVFVPDGTYKITGQISQDRSSDTTLGVVNIVGAGRNSVFINHTGATSLFYVVGHGTAAEGQTKGIRVAGMTLLGSATANSVALGFTLVSFPVFEDLEIQGFDYAFYFQDTDHCSFNAIQARFNNHGLFARKNPAPVANSTMPNQYTFNECHFGANLYDGLFNGGGAAWAFSGGSIESNGGSNPGAGFGLRCENCGYEGGAIVTMNGTYVESNNGLADIVLIQTLASAPVITQAVYNFIGTTFNRASATLVATNVILTNFAAVASVGEQIVNLVGCNFKSLGAYTPNAGRPYLNWSGAQTRNAKNFSAPGTIFEDALEAPTFVQNISKPFIELSRNGTQAVSNATATDWQLDTINYSFSWPTTISANSIVVTDAGVYSLSAALVFTATMANVGKIEILRNGATLLSATFSTTDSYMVAGNKYLAAGDIISVRVTQNSGAGATLAGSGTAPSYLNITKVVDA